MVSFKAQNEYEINILELIKEELLSEKPAKYLIDVHRKKNVTLPYISQPKNISELIELPENSRNITITGTMFDVRPIKSFTRRDGSGSGCRQQFRLDDDTGSLRIVVWGENQNASIFLSIENVITHRGTIEITRGTFKVNLFHGVTYLELHLSDYYYPTISPIFD